MTDSTAINVGYAIARAINDASYVIYFGLIIHAIVTAIGRGLSK